MSEAIKEGPANLQRGLETVGGKLVLTKEALIFSPHDANFQRQKESIDLDSIQSVSRAWTKFLGFIPLLPNSLCVSTKNEDFYFVLSGRDAWALAIEGQVHGL